MSKPEYNAQIYNMQLRLLEGKNIEIIVYSRVYLPGYDMNEMISYLINEQISVDDLLSEWNDRQNEVNEYLEVGELSNQIINDWIQEIIKINNDLRTKTRGGLRLQDIKGSLDDIRTKEYKDLKIMDFVNVLIRNYDGDVLAMMKSAEKGHLNTKMEEEEFDDNDIVIEKENKVPLKQDKAVDQIALRFGRFTIELPSDPSEVNVTTKELENKLEENRIQIQGNTFIFYGDDGDDEVQEKQIYADISGLFKEYKKLEEWMKNKGVTEEPLTYLIKIIINNLGNLGAFQAVVQGRYMKREAKIAKKAAEREKKKAEKAKKEAKAAKKKKGFGLKEMRGKLQGEIQEEVNKGAKKKSRRAVKGTGTDNGITTEKKEPVQQSSTIPIGAFPGEQSNNANGASVVDKDLQGVQNERENFDPAKYGLPETVPLDKEETIIIRLDGTPLDNRMDGELLYYQLLGKEFKIDDIQEANGNILNTEIANIIKKYKEIMKLEISSFGVILLMLVQQGLLDRYKEMLKKKIGENKKEEWNQIDREEIESHVSQQVSDNEITRVQITGNQFTLDLDEQERERKRKEREQERKERMPKVNMRISDTDILIAEKERLAILRSLRRDELLKSKRGKLKMESSDELKTELENGIQ